MAQVQTLAQADLGYNQEYVLPPLQGGYHDSVQYPGPGFPGAFDSFDSFEPSYPPRTPATPNTPATPFSAAICTPSISTPPPQPQHAGKQQHWNYESLYAPQAATSYGMGGISVQAAAMAATAAASGQGYPYTVSAMGPPLDISIRGPEEKTIKVERTPTRPNNKSSSSDSLVWQRGLRVLIRGRKDSAFGDTGAGQNMISDHRREELGLEMSSNPTSFPMGNSKRIFSPGTVKVPIAFEDDPTNIMTIVAHVVRTFAYDLVLGNPFLKATKCLKNYIHRFVPCLFSLKSGWSMNLLGETTTRFRGQLGKGIEVLALPDIGSVRNVMNADWAMERATTGGIKILSRPENRGWIVLPDGTEEATVGQARTTMTLPDGKVVLMVFELLPNCYAPVVLGQDFVFDQHIYTKYSGSLRELSDYDSGDEFMPMGYRQSRSEEKRTGQGATTREVDKTDDLERQLEWNLRHQNGRNATPEEWDLESSRREEYERRRDPNWQPGLPLIQYKSQGYDYRPPIPSCDSSNSNSSNGMTPGDAVSPPRSAQTLASNSTVSSPSHETPVRDTGHSSADSSSGENGTGGTWDSLYLADFGRDEAAQWQEEQPI